METSDETEDFGVVYVATGETYAKLAIASAQSVRNHHPSVSITIFTDQKTSNDLEDELGIFSAVKNINNPTHTWDDKIYGIKNTPYDKTVYLDADTIVIRPIIDQLDAGLDYYPLLIRGKMGFNFEWEEAEYPGCIPQYNTGVIAYRSSQEIMNFLELWSELRNSRPDGHDQPTFREALLKSQVPYSDIRPSFNYFSGGSQLVMNKVRILHDVQNLADHSQNSKIIKNTLDINTPAGVIRGKTVWDSSGWKTKNLLFLFFLSLIPQIVIKAKINVENNGIRDTAKKGWKVLWSKTVDFYNIY
jgi:hypothetical protein